MSHDTKKKKKRFQLLSSQNNMGLRAVRVDGTQAQLLWAAGSSLFILKTSVGVPGSQLPQKGAQGYSGAGFLLFRLVNPQEVLKYCPEQPQRAQPQLLPTPSTSPRRPSPWWARVHVTPSAPVTAAPAPSRRGATAWRAPKRFVSVVSIVVISIQGAGTP